jgi:hypothetical protein
MSKLGSIIICAPLQQRGGQRVPRGAGVRAPVEQQRALRRALEAARLGHQVEPRGRGDAVVPRHLPANDQGQRRGVRVRVTLTPCPDPNPLIRIGVSSSGWGFQWRAAERGHPTGRERTGSPTLQLLQDPILLQPWGLLSRCGFSRLNLNDP